MDLGELNRYIAGLHRAGFDVANLTVQWHVKIAYPLIAPISMLLAIPVRFSSRRTRRHRRRRHRRGHRHRLLEHRPPHGSHGRRRPTPPFLSAWSPDLIFLFIGLYFFFKIPT